MSKGKYALATFIDISSAFDKLNPVKATQALIRKGVDRDITSWYQNYLQDRHASIEIKGAKTRRRITIGCPQGGVLSTILWNVAFDDLLSIFNYNSITCAGYADDGSLIITGKSLKIMYRDMNEALRLCREWALSYGLDISPLKTNFMLFTNKLSK